MNPRSSSNISTSFSGGAVNRGIRRTSSTRFKVRQLPISPLLYVLALEPFPQKLDVIRSVPRDQDRENSVTAYADDITIIVPEVRHIQRADDDI